MTIVFSSMVLACQALNFKLALANWRGVEAQALPPDHVYKPTNNTNWRPAYPSSHNIVYPVNV